MEDNYTYDQAALSRSEADLNADVQDPEPRYDQPPLSRIEYLLQQIAGGISSGIHLRGVVSSDEGLPETAENGDMYFVGPDADGAYREVVWLSSKEDWEELGYNAIDVDAFLPSDANLKVVTTSSTKKIAMDTLFQPTDGNDLVTKSYVDTKVSSEFESNLLTYVDAHTITQAAYDALTDKTGFWFIKEATT